MKLLNCLIICCGIITITALYYAYRHEIIIIRQQLSLNIASTINTTQRKTIQLWYWAHHAWHSQQEEVIWPEDIQQQYICIMHHWLQYMIDEHYIQYTLNLQTALISFSGQDLYLSFDKSLFSKEQSTFEKLMIVEGILKTIREVNNTVKSVHFLVNHKPLEDVHLDCSHGWHIDGYLTDKSSTTFKP